MRTEVWRRGLGIAALVLALSLGDRALAQYAAQPAFSGSGLVVAKDALRNTVTIGATSYRLTDRTKLEGMNGEEIGFPQIPVFEDGSDGSSGHVQFEAHEGAGGLELESLRLTPQPR